MAVSRTAPENRSYDMAQPAPYNRAYNFSNWQAGNPTVPLPGTQVDIELSRVKLVTDQIRAALAFIQRDDLALANASVGLDQLKAEVTIGLNSPTAWLTATAYIANDTVFYQYKFYKCLVSHTSGTFSTDLAASYWLELADFSATQQAALIVYDNSTSGLVATNMQAAMDELVASVIVSSVHGRIGAVVAVAGDYSADEVTFDPTGLTEVSGTDVQAALESVDAAFGALGTAAAADTGDFATAAQGAKADTALQPADRPVATSAEYRVGTAEKGINVDQAWGAMAEVALTDAATIAWDMSAGIDFTVTLTASRTLGNPTNTTVGKKGRIRVVQDGTGGWTLTKSSNHKTAGGAALTIPTTASAESYIYYDCVSSTKILLSNSPLAWS